MCHEKNARTAARSPTTTSIRSALLGFAPALPVGVAKPLALSIFAVWRVVRGPVCALLVLDLALHHVEGVARLHLQVARQGLDKDLHA